MDRATCIVALPPVGDRINKISSEAVPHLTMLYLGEADLSEDAILYVQHAAAELSPFGLSVDYRGELGPDKADVLFFEKTAWDLDRVNQFRHYLLLNDEIKRAYESTEQYPEWTPHLTLGYPEAPAREKDDEDVYMGYIHFDRIAIWMGDFEGPEFRLKYADLNDYGSGGVMMSEMTTAQRGEQAAAEIFHFGVKGMKWGVRKNDSGGGGAKKPRGAIKRGLTKAGTALDAGQKVIDQGEKKLIFLPHDKRQKAASATQTRILGHAAAINRDPKYKGKDLKTNPQLRQSYHDAVKKAAVDIYQEELTNQRVEYAKDIMEAIMPSRGDRVDITAPKSSMRHSDEDDELLLSLQFDLDENDQITGASLAHSVLDDGDTMQYFATLNDEDGGELEHYGVKGMKWGVSRADRSASARDTAARNQRIAEGTASKKDKIDQAIWGKGMHGFGGAISLNKKVAARLATKYDKKADKLDAKIEAKNRKNEAIAAHKKWKEEAGGTEMANKVFQKAAKDFEKTAEIINNDPNYKGKDVTKGLVGKQYQATMNHYFNQHMAQASVDLTLNDQGRAYIYQFDSRTGLMRGTEHQAVFEHADGAGSKFEMPDYKVELDDQGHMISFTLVGELYHYGVKGMKWGVTTKDGATSATQTREKTSHLVRGAKDVTVSQRKAGTYVKAKGGERQKAHDDAVRAQAGRRVAKKSTTDALSNKQLEDTIKRMRLEQEFSKLDSKVKRQGQGFVSRLFRSPEMRSVAADMAKKVSAKAGT